MGASGARKTGVGRPLAARLGVRYLDGDDLRSLKRACRTYIVQDAPRAPGLFIHLTGASDVVEAGIKARKDHFLPAALPANPFATLKSPRPDDNAITIAIDQSLDPVVDATAARLGACQNDQYGRADRRGSHGRRDRRAAG